jgi:hypothetical protein
MRHYLAADWVTLSIVLVVIIGLAVANEWRLERRRRQQWLEARERLRARWRKERGDST